MHDVIPSSSTSDIYYVARVLTRAEQNLKLRVDLLQRSAFRKGPFMGIRKIFFT